VGRVEVCKKMLTGRIASFAVRQLPKSLSEVQFTYFIFSDVINVVQCVLEYVMLSVLTSVPPVHSRLNLTDRYITHHVPLL